MEIDVTQFTGDGRQPEDEKDERPIPGFDDTQRIDRDPVRGHGELDQRDPPWPPADDPAVDEPDRRSPGEEQSVRRESVSGQGF